MSSPPSRSPRSPRGPSSSSSSSSTTSTTTSSSSSSATSVVPRGHIAQLPVELLIHIWTYVSLRDLPALARTCQYWATVTRNFMPRELNLTRLDYVDDLFVNFVATSLKPTSVDLSGCHKVSESSLRNLVTGCPSLKVLRLSGLRLSSMSTWHLASKARCLDMLDLSHSDLGSTAVSWACASTLKKVCLQGTTYPNRLEPIWNWAAFTSLRTVEIVASETTLRCLAAIPTLVEVVFHGGDIRVTDENLTVIRRLRRLVLRNISVYSNYPIRPIWNAMKEVLAAAQALEELEIDSPRPAALTDTYFCEWIVECKRLQVLHLVCNAKTLAGSVSDRGLRALVATCGPTLRDVRIQNGNPTDLGIMALLEGSPLLERLHLPFSASLTEVAFAMAPVHCPKLQELDLTGCTSISRPCIEQLAHELPLLTHLRAYGLHHALSDYYDSPGAPPSPRTLAAVRRSCNVASNYPWTKIDGSLGLSTTAFQLVRSGLQLDYWPPPAVIHRSTKVSLPRSRSRVEVPSPVSLGGLDYMCECLATACAHGCGAIVPHCVEEDHATVCPRAPVACLFVGLGCRAVVSRSEYHSHLRTCKCNEVVCTTCHVSLPRAELDDHLMRHLDDHALRNQQGCPLRNEGCTSRCDNPVQHLGHDCRYYVMRCSMCTAVVLRGQLARHSCLVRKAPMPHLGLVPLPTSVGADRWTKYTRQSPTSSPQITRSRPGSTRRSSSLTNTNRRIFTATAAHATSSVGAMVLRLEARPIEKNMAVAE